MKRLVVTADDLGYSGARNRGIFEAIERGVVTSASVMAGKAGTEEAVRYCARNAGVFGVGLHLNLSEGDALAGRSSLTDDNGRFLDRRVLRARLADGAIVAGDVVRELVAQLGSLAERGATPTHLDGHHHLQLEPAVAAAIASHLPALGIRWVRAEVEAFTGYVPCTEAFTTEHARLAARAAVAREHYRAAGLAWAQAFCGTAMSVHRAWGLDASLRMLAELPDGLCEWMTHPGHDDPDGDDYARNGRTREVQILTDPVLRDRIAALGFTLTSFHADRAD